jgi:hypothetical protein
MMFSVGDRVLVYGAFPGQVFAAYPDRMDLVAVTLDDGGVFALGLKEAKKMPAAMERIACRTVGCRE